MNLKFWEDIYKTFTDMRSGIYILGYLAGIQAASFALYLTYKYMKDESSENKESDENGENKESEENGESYVEETSELQMEPIYDESIKSDEKELYSLLTSKRDELESLISQLTTVQGNIMTIRDKLEELNKNQDNKKNK